MHKNLYKVMFKTIGAVALGVLVVGNEVIAQSLPWSSAGPVYLSGRCRNMIVDKANPSGNTLFLGSSTSGLFKSTDAGLNWTNIENSITGPVESIKNISYLGQAQNNDLIIGTGEGFLRPSQKLKSLPGTGLYRLSGNTLTSIANATITGTEINRIACSPLNSNIFALATNKGILITNDGGATFVQPASITFTDNLNYGLDVKFDGAGILYFSVGNEKTSIPNVDSKVYKSNDVSLTSFTDITPTSPFVLGTNYGRIELAVAPTNNNVIYASVARKYLNTSNPAASSLMGLFVSYNGGSTWAHIFSGSTQLDPLGNGSGTSASGDFAHTLSVDPLNSDRIYLGSFQMYSYTKTGMSGSNPVGTWSKIGNHLALNTGLYLHENVHDFKAILSGGSISRYYFITDAGTYRSSDNLISIQPFYKGMATGQFNSISISAFPKFTASNANSNGSVYTPYIKYIGGTGGSGLNYFDGQNGTTVSKEFNSLSGEVFNAEYSKILPEAAYFSTANGRLFLNSDVVNNSPELRQHLRRTSDQNVVDFANSNYALTGTPFRLWENYGQLPAPNRPSPDSVIFYNDSVRGLASLVGVSNLTTTTSFTLSISRPSGVSMLDSIAIRTGTAVLPVSGGNANSPAFPVANRRTIWIKLPNTYTSSSTGTTSINNLTVTGSAASVTGHSVILDGGTAVDQIVVNFATAPFLGVATNSVSGVPDPSAYYKVFATAYYKIAPNTQIQVVDKSISTKDFTYTAITPSTGLNWKFGSSQTSTMVAASLPTNVIASGLTYSAASTENVLGPQSTATFFPSHPTAVTYTIRTYGSSYSVTANTYSNYIANTPTVAGTPTYVLQPGNVTQSSNVFTIAATQTSAVVYTVTANGATTLTTNYTVNPVTYSINTSTVTQTSNVFTLSSNGNYTITAISGASAFTPTANILTTVSLPVTTTATVGNNNAKIAPNNKPIKIATLRSARLAYPYSSGASNGIYVSLSPLSLNDPLSHICVSRDGALTTNSVGVPISTTINIDGNITLLEWANSGTELYFATDANKLYRVSRLFALADSSARFYNGKFHTGVLNHNTVTPNPNSPVRTTLLRTFAKPITSIAIGGRDSIMAVTFDGTGAAGDTLVAISNGDIRTQSGSALTFKKADGTGMPLASGASIKTYCSLFEKSDPNKLFVGATDGIYYTNNALSSNTWLNQSGTSATSFPKIQVFDLKQQTKASFHSYNSGQIFAATNGRGVWYNSDFLVKLVVAVPEELPAEKESNIKVYPNPTSSYAVVSFNSIEGESAMLNIMDLTGKIVKTQSLGKLYNGETNVEINTDEMTGGVYLINVSSTSGTKRVTKLVVAK
jgi:hypothetical protein